MKHSKLFSIGLLILSSALNDAAFAEHTIVDRGAFHRVWRDSETGGQYTELENGLHYWDPKRRTWEESEDLIEISPDGGAIARRGPTVVKFKANANTVSAVEMTTDKGKKFKSHVRGLYYFDAETGASIELARIKDTTGILYPPNQLVFPDAFAGDVAADLHYVYTKSAFQQNIVLLKAPPPPTAYGLNAETTRLEVWTDFIQIPAGKTRAVVLKRESDVLRRSLGHRS